MVLARRTRVRNVAWKACSAACWSCSTRRQALSTSGPCRHTSSSKAPWSLYRTNWSSSWASETAGPPGGLIRSHTFCTRLDSCGEAMALPLRKENVPLCIEARRGRTLPTILTPPPAGGDACSGYLLQFALGCSARETRFLPETGVLTRNIPTATALAKGDADLFATPPAPPPDPQADQPGSRHVIDGEEQRNNRQPQRSGI